MLLRRVYHPQLSIKIRVICQKETTRVKKEKIALLRKVLNCIINYDIIHSQESILYCLFKNQQNSYGSCRFFYITLSLLIKMICRFWEISMVMI